VYALFLYKSDSWVGVKGAIIQGVIYTDHLTDHRIAFELEEILGHRSAHSLEVGPVIALPLISPLLFAITPALSSKYTKVPSLLLKSFLCLMTTPWQTRRVNKGAAAGLTSLSEGGLTLLDRADDHVADGGLGETVLAGFVLQGGDHVEVLGATVVGAVHDGRVTEGHGDLVLDSDFS
jgi:hypothetical protein